MYTVSIDVSVAVTSDNSIALGWVVPDLIIAQHTAGDTYTIAVTPDCRNGQSNVNTPQLMVIPYDGERSVEITGLGTFYTWCMYKEMESV